MDHEDLKEIRLDLEDAYGVAEAARMLSEATERKAQFLAECEAERAEREAKADAELRDKCEAEAWIEAALDAEMFGGYEDYEPSPYFGDYSEM